MAKVLGRLMLIVIPVLFVLGLTRFAMRGFEGSLLPEYPTIQSWFASFPNVVGDIQNAVSKYSTLDYDSGVCLPDFTNVFNPHCQYVGNPLFNFMGATFETIWAVIKAPFEVLGWFFGNFFAV